MSSILDNADRCWSTLVDVERYLVDAGVLLNGNKYCPTVLDDIGRDNEWERG